MSPGTVRGFLFQIVLSFSEVAYLWNAIILTQIMKLTVLKGPELGAITSYELVDRHRAEAPQFQNHEKISYCHDQHEGAAGSSVAYPLGAAFS